MNIHIKRYKDLRFLEDSIIGILDFYDIDLEKKNNIAMQMKCSFRKALLVLLLQEGEAE